MDEKIEAESGSVSRALWGCVRAVVFLLGLGLAVGGGFLMTLMAQGLGWWGLVLGILFFGLGCWWMWCALFGKRSSVDSVFSELLSKLLSD